MQKTDDELIKRMIANQAKAKNVATPLNKNVATPIKKNTESAFSTAYKNKIGYNVKDLPTYRPDNPKPTGALDKYVFDPLNKITSGTMYPIAKSYANFQRARDQGKAGQYFRKELFKNVVGGPVRYLKDMYTGASGDINYTGKSVVSQVFDDPKGIRSNVSPQIRQILDNNAVRTGAGFGLEVAGDLTNYVPIGAPFKAAGKVAGKGLKAVGATDNLIKPTIKAAKEVGPVRTVLKRFGALTPELSKAEQAVNKLQRSMGAEISDSIYKFLQGSVDPRRIEDMKTYVKVLVNGTAKVADDAPEAAKLLAKGLPTGLTKQAAKQFTKAFDQEMDTAVKTMEKLGKNIDQELLQRHFMGAVDATNFSKDYENIVKPFRRLEKEVVTEGLIKAKVITRETAERYPNYARKFYPVVKEQGTIEGLDLVAKGSQKIGLEMGLSKMAKGDELRAIEYMMGKSDAKEYTGVLNRYQKLLGGKTALEEKNRVARKLRPQLEKLFGDQLPMVAYEQQITRDMVQNASITIAKTIEQGLNRVTTENFLNLTTKHFGKTAKEVAAMGAEGKFYKQIPLSKRYGDLMGKYVPDSIYEDVVGILSVKNNWLTKATNAWKQLKLFSPLNFASVSRNQFGDMILMSVSESPMPIARQLADLPKAIMEYRNQGPVYKAMLERGVFANTFAAQEGTKSLAKATGKVDNSLLNVAQDGLNKFTDVNVKTFIPGLGAGKEMYAYTSDINKINMVQYQISKGKSIDEAIRLADKATFNYGALPQGLAGFRDNFMPFMTFKYFALQLAWDTLINRTGKIATLPKVKRAVEGLSEPQPGEEQGLPDYIKENRGLNVRLPWKNEKGDSRYLNLQYTYPFGDTLGTTPLEVMLGNPLVRTPIEIAKNESFYYGQPIADKYDTRGKQALEYGKYALEQLGPKPGLREFGKVSNAITGAPDRYGNRREILPTALDLGFGIKTNAPDIELGQKFAYYDKKNELDEIESKMRSISRDQSLSERQRDKEIARLKEKYQKIYFEK